MNNGLLAEALAAGRRAAEKPLKTSERLYRELLAEWLAELEQNARPVGHTTVSNEPRGSQEEGERR